MRLEQVRSGYVVLGQNVSGYFKVGEVNSG
jgi:hypothetical protein